MSELRSVDVCAGAGGLALGLEQAGFDPVLLLDNKAVACETLHVNRPTWNVLEMDLLDFIPDEHPKTYDVDLLSAGLPRVKSSATAARAETKEEQRLLEAAVLLTHSIQPRALLIENVPGLVDAPEFEPLRTFIREELEHLGYRLRWFVLNAADFGVPQDRKQGVLVALKDRYFDLFRPPLPTVKEHVPVGKALRRSMAARGWSGADAWAAQALSVAPTLVGGSDNRGGADLGPTGTKKAWARMGVNGGALANEVPGPDLDDSLDMIKLTDSQAALLQGFPREWQFAGRKTARYRQIGHASPPPVGAALGRAVAVALEA
ncbi:MULTISPECIES: DNA cytosine methyltransferase [unclassified Streptomyces]|uniref:DNA cytosine methyltransferase n=1 Tax=unclassified Streptomyces TaxID=2593676 RepID=UPI002DD82701|nr:DNA cytosine methyltransferase [Streptomyces sp. NBC_01751]WSD24984.1 DNA cytosine methyltransferase [Streptomyces sp. NBC_01751]WSF86538.1 DNA cytosine methyltransferase [Streptomyces sp. NBC_01744]